MLIDSRLPTLDALRGIGSLAVMWFHFSLQPYLFSNVINLSGKYGWLGVHVFFVVSGFVIPYAMVRSKFGVSDYWRFLLKRITRLDPPYLVTILLIIGYRYLATTTPTYQGPPFHLSVTQTILHVAYLNAFFEYEWFNPVFWSLAIEFQYYLAIGVLFPVLFNPNSYLRIAVVFALAALSFIPQPGGLIGPFMPLFLLGIITLQKYLGLLSLLAYIIVTIMLSVITMRVLGLAVAIVGSGTAILIAYVRIESRVLAFFGLISYSLDLLHAPIGLKVLQLAMASVDNPYWSLVLTLAIIIPVVTIYYWLVEKPSQRLSARFGYKKEMRKCGNVSCAL